MDGQKIAVGLFLVLIASGCAEMTGNATRSSSFEDLSLSLKEVEAATGANYGASDLEQSRKDFNFSSTARKVETFFTRESNLSEAPDSVRSMVVALNGSETRNNVEPAFNETVSIGGYQAKRKKSGNQVVLYGQRDNFSYFVQAKGNKGIYSSTKKLYLEIAKQVDKFNRRPN